MKTTKNGHKKGATSAGPEITQNIGSLKTNITNYITIISTNKGLI